MGKDRRSARLLLLSSLLLLCAVVLAAGAATAAAPMTRGYQRSFGPDGSEFSTFDEPGPVAVDPGDGTVYVAELGKGSVARFDAQGQPSDFAASGSSRLTGFGLRARESQLAVSPVSHDLFVADVVSNSVKAFQADGEPAEFPITGSNELSGGFLEVCGVAVGATGDIYVGDYEKISVFSPTGDPLTTLAAPEPCNLAVDGEGVVYSDRLNQQVERYRPSSNPPTATTTYKNEGQVDELPAYTVAVDPATDDVYVSHAAGVSQYDADGELVATFADRGLRAVKEPPGVAIGSAGPYVSDLYGTGRVNLYGPVSEVGSEPPETALIVGAPTAFKVTKTSAIVFAEVAAPPGAPATIRVEYGPAACVSSPCASTGAVAAGESGEPRPIEIGLVDLSVGTTYHYRLVVENAGGVVRGPDQTLTTVGPDPAPEALPDGRAYELVSPSEPESDNAEFGVPFVAGGFVRGNVKPQRAAAGGDAVAFDSFAAVADPISAPPVSTYLSRRGVDGWKPANITPSAPTQGLLGPIQGLGEDLAFAGLASLAPPLAPGAVAGYQNLYLRDNATGSLRALTTTAPSSRAPNEFCVVYRGASADGSKVIFSANGGLTADSPPAAERDDQYIYEWTASAGVSLVSVLPGGAPASPTRSTGFGRGGSNNCTNGRQGVTPNAISRDGSKVFWTRGDFEANDEKAKHELYVRVDGQSTIEVDRSRGGKDPDGGGVFLAATPDGSMVFFSDPNRLLPGAGREDIYRYDVADEELIDLSPGEEPAGVEGLMGASDDGSRAYFVATAALVEGAVAGESNVYFWESGSPLRLVATLSSSRQNNPDQYDWSYGLPGDYTGGGGHTSTVTPDGGALAFVSIQALTGYDNRIVGRASCLQLDLGEETGPAGCAEVYLYEAAAERIVCASCDPTGARPSGEPPLGRLPFSTVAGWANETEETRYLAPNGKRIFFESYAALVPTDINRNRDVYEFERAGIGTCTTASATYGAESDGCVYLISSGTSDDDSFFLDASSSGGDAFFSTRSPLVGADRDVRFDVYDARIGGGFPPPAAATPPCRDEGSCRPGATAAPTAPAPASSAPSGQGNLRVCSAKQVRRHGRCVRRHRRHGHHRHRLHRHRKKGKHHAGNKRKHHADRRAS